jgi:hypothetical protein
MTVPDDSSQVDATPHREPDSAGNGVLADDGERAHDGVQRFARWAIGIGVVLMLGGWVLIPLLPDAPLVIQWSLVIAGLALFGLGLRVFVWWGMEVHPRARQQARIRTKRDKEER